MITHKIKECFWDIIKGAGPYWLYGLTPEAKSYVTALLRDEIKGTFLFIAPRDSEAQNIYEDLLTFFPSSKEIFFLPPQEEDSDGKRLRILHQLAKGNNILVVASLVKKYHLFLFWKKIAFDWKKEIKLIEIPS